MRRHVRHGGFTLAEMSVVVGIAGVVTCITAVAALYAMRSNDERAAIAEIRSFETALVRFQAKRGRMPLDLDNSGITTSFEVIKQLKDWGLLGDDFSDMDPWGNPYVIVLKRDYGTHPGTVYDLDCLPLNDTPGGFQVYSYGRDGETYFINTADVCRDDISNFPVADS